MGRLLIIPTCVLALACGSTIARVPIIVGQAGVAVTDSLGRISDATAQLQKAGTLPTASALRVQETLLQINTALQPLPDLLRVIDAAQQAGQIAAPGDVERAIAILQAVAPRISTLLAGVPATDTTKQLITFVSAAQQSVTTVLLEIAKLRPHLQARIYESNRAA